MPRSASPVNSPATLQSRATQVLRSGSLVVVRCLSWFASPARNLSTLGGTLKRGLKTRQAPKALAAAPKLIAASSGGNAMFVAEGDTERRSLLLQQALRSMVLPALVTRQRQAPAGWSALEAQVSELASLVLAACPRAASTLVRDAFAVAGSLVHLLTALIEPAARRLGDLWRSDDCSEVDVTLGLCHLQTAVRRLKVGRVEPTGSQARFALLVPQPGENHILSTALHADLAWQAGWEAKVEFPTTDTALQILLASRWFDLLDLSTSAAFGREHWVERIATTVALARGASLNPEMVVVVSGRMFQDGGRAADDVGADSVSNSAWHFLRSLKAASEVAPREGASEVWRIGDRPPRDAPAGWSKE